MTSSPSHALFFEKKNARAYTKRYNAWGVKCFFKYSKEYDKTVIYLSLRDYPADSNGIISAFCKAPTTDILNFVSIL